MTRKSYNNKKANVNPVDQISRFNEGTAAEISTDMGWVQATVAAILQIPEGVLYKVSYIPLWDTTERKPRFTVVTGAAIR